MGPGKKALLEKHTRFSNSVLWDYQREYFEKLGINAWAGQVPFYITSNPFICNGYANIVIRYIQDHVNTDDYDATEPFYLLELGTGPGRFSFYVMQRVFELQEALGLQHVKIVYIMTDFTDSNLEFWNTQPQLAPYVEQGKLDFAIYNLEHQQDITLVKSKKTLGRHSVKNPLCVFANYIFDTVSHDAFHVRNGKLQEALSRVKIDSKYLQHKKPTALEKLDVSFDYRSLKKEDYYNDPHVNKVLHSYADLLKQEGSFLIPIGALRCIQNLADIANEKLMIISTDKGHTHPFELEGKKDPSVVFHGSFSMMVNFHAIGEYMRARGGDAFHQEPRQSINTSVFFLGDQLDKLPETHLAVQRHVDDFGPGDFFNFHEHIKYKPEQWNIKMLLSHMHFCRWDPHIFKFITAKINEEITDAPATIVNGFIEGAQKIADHFYWMPDTQDTLFELAIMLHTIKHYDLAATYYKKSLGAFGPQFPTLYNAGLCHYLMGAKQQSLELFQSALETDPSSDETRKWITRLEGEIA